MCFAGEAEVVNAVTAQLYPGKRESPGQMKMLYKLPGYSSKKADIETFVTAVTDVECRASEVEKYSK